VGYIPSEVVMVSMDNCSYLKLTSPMVVVILGFDEEKREYKVLHKAKTWKIQEEDVRNFNTKERKTLCLYNSTLFPKETLKSILFQKDIIESR